MGASDMPRSVYVMDGPEPMRAFAFDQIFASTGGGALYVLSTRLEQAERELARERERGERFEKFARWAVEEGAWQGGDLDGAAVQEKATELGILVPVEVKEACAENCNCSEWDDFPQTCYRFAAEPASAGEGEGT